MHNLIIFAGIVSFVLYFGTYIRVPIIPLFAKDIGASVVQIGLLTGAFMFSATVCAIPFGILSDRLGRKKLLLFAVLVGSLSSLLIAFSSTVFQLFLFGLIAGVGIAAFTPAMMSYVGDISTSANIGRYYGIYTTAIYLGMTLGPMVGGIFAEFFGYRNTFFLSSFANFLAFILAVFTIKGKGKVKIHLADEPFLSSIDKLFQIKRYVGALVATFSLCFCWGGLMAFLPVYAKSIGISTTSIGLLYGFQSVFNTISRFPSGYFIDKLGEKRYFILFGLILVTPFVALVGYLNNFLLLSTSVSFIGFGMGISFSAIGSLISEVVPSNIRGTAMGLYSTLIYGGLMVSSIITGPIVQAFSYGVAYLTLGIVNFAGSILFYYLSDGEKKII